VIVLASQLRSVTSGEPQVLPPDVCDLEVVPHVAVLDPHRADPLVRKSTHEAQCPKVVHLGEERFRRIVGDRKRRARRELLEVSSLVLCEQMVR
jgi:hypothetical protein